MMNKKIRSDKELLDGLQDFFERISLDTNRFIVEWNALGGGLRIRETLLKQGNKNIRAAIDEFLDHEEE